MDPKNQQNSSTKHEQTYNRAKGNPPITSNTNQLGAYLFTKLSIVRILPLAALHKKDTLLGAFTHQILFQGKGSVGGLARKL